MKPVDPRGVALCTSVFKRLEASVEQRAFRRRAARRRYSEYDGLGLADGKGPI